MKLFVVLYDGAARPIIETPSGRWLSLSSFERGRWSSYDKEDSDCRTIVQALNFLLVHSPEILAQWETEQH